MKKLGFCSLILMLCFVFAVPAQAAEEESLGFWFESQVLSNGISRVMGSYEREIIGPLGFSVFAEQDSDGYRQFYAGPTVKPFDWLKVGVGIGMEHVPDAGDDSNSTRYNAFFDVNWEEFHIYGSFENGNAGGPWHELRAVYNPTEKFGIGIMDEKNLGLGPRVEYNIRKNVQAWVAVLHDRDTGKDTSMFAVNFSF